MIYRTLKMNDDLVLYFPTETPKSLSPVELKDAVEFILNQNGFNCIGPGALPDESIGKTIERELAYIEFYKGDFLSVDIVDKTKVAIRRLSNHPSDKRKKFSVIVSYGHLSDQIYELLSPLTGTVNGKLTDVSEFLIRYVMCRLYKKPAGVWPNHSAILNEYFERAHNSSNESSRLYRLMVELEDLFWFDIDPSRLSVYIHEPKTKSVILYFNVNGALS